MSSCIRHAFLPAIAGSQGATRHIVGLLALFTSALVATAPAQATDIYTGNIQVTATDPTQSGRLSRNGIPQDWSGGEPFPGEINSITSYNYFVRSLDVNALEAGYVYGPYLQISFDSESTTTFLSTYLDSYNPTSKSTNWLGDAGISGNVSNFGNPVTFQIVVPSGHQLLLVLNSTADSGLGSPGNLLIEGFSDTMYTDLSPVPEPGTVAMVLAGIMTLAGARGLRSKACPAANG